MTVSVAADYPFRRMVDCEGLAAADPVPYALQRYLISEGRTSTGMRERIAENLDTSADRMPTNTFRAFPG